MSSRTFLSALAVALALGRPALASPANLVVNGGFEGPVSEDGQPDGWTYTSSPAGSKSQVDDNLGAHTGSGSYEFFAFRGVIPAALRGNAAPAEGTISQQIATTVGHAYHVSFWLRAQNDPSTDFTAEFAGRSMTLTDPRFVPDAANNFYGLLSFDVTASASMSDLSFSGRDGVHFLLLDDVSVTDLDTAANVAEPTSLAALLTGAVGIGFLRRRHAA